MASARNRRPPAPLPTQFEIGRHTFFDFGPPTDYYELFLVRPAISGTSIQRITLTPAIDACTPAKMETKVASINDSIATLFGTSNPCAIPEKEVRRELKRRKKCLVFSGANVRMRIQCATQTRIIHSDVLDKDMFDATPNTPEHTSWTMQLLQRLDQAVGYGVIDQPIFPIPGRDKPSESSLDEQATEDLRSGKYDALFDGAPDKPSDLYVSAQIPPAVPSVRLVASSPFQPDDSVLPGYPPLARAARIEGAVVFRITIDPDGRAASFTVQTGHPLLRVAVENAVSRWRFPKDAAHHQVQATIEFALNCPARPRIEARPPNSAPSACAPSEIPFRYW